MAGTFVAGSGKGAGRTYSTSDGLTAADTSGLVQINQDNTKAILEALDSGLVAALALVGEQAEKNAKAETPVDTGRLRNSITYALDSSEPSVYVGTNVDYGIFVEKGTVHHPEGAHMLEHAATQHASEYEAILKRSIKP